MFIVGLHINELMDVLDNPYNMCEIENGGFGYIYFSESNTKYGQQLVNKLDFHNKLRIRQRKPSTSISIDIENVTKWK